MTPPDPAGLAAASARLTARLERDVDHPVALALSGGGDSMALLHLAADWARAHGRRLLALTVDHGLNPDSTGWTARAGEAARAVGADWRALAWTGDKPSTGLPAAARRARHRLIATAAREAGARVVLFAHTADDVAEGEAMRADGSSLGRLRDWAPSPAWPEGRGLMLLRPLLDVRRETLRAWLRRRGVDWIEDPGNADLRFARSRARRDLAGTGGKAGLTPATLAGGPLPVPLGEGVFSLDRATTARILAAALVCAGGGEVPPRGVRLARMLARLAAGEDFTAVLCGARLEAAGDRVVAAREAGEFRRGAAGPLALVAGVEAVWDGRYAVRVPDAGWSVAPAAGLTASLARADRAWLKALPAGARGAQPVLIRNAGGAPILASPAGRARSLVEERLARALDGMTHERDPGPQPHGATPRNHLFSGVNI